MWNNVFTLACNRPTGGVGFALLFFFLNLNPHHGRTWREHVRDFDFIGLTAIVAGVVLILVGFNFSESSCQYNIDPDRVISH